MPELIDNYNIYLYSGRNDNDLEHDSKNYLPFTNDYSNVMHFNTKEDRDKYFEVIPHYIVEQTDEYKAYLDGGTIKLAFGAGLRIECEFENIRYMRIDSAWGTQEPPPGVAPYNYIVSAKYYFVNSYEIISSYNGVTIVMFNIEYDYWMNNQFDFEIKESNVERSHMDRWDSDGKIIYKKPMGDALDSYGNVESVYKFSPQKALVESMNKGYTQTDIIWALITCSHTLGSKADSIFYHIVPLIYKKDDLSYTYPFPSDDKFYIQNSCIASQFEIDDSPFTIYYPSLECLSNARLLLACGLPMTGSAEDKQQILNIQILNYLPFRILPKRIEYEGIEVNSNVVCWMDGTPLPYIISTNFLPSVQNYTFMSSFVPELSMITKQPGSVTDINDQSEKILPVTNTPLAPLMSHPYDIEYDDNHEPALFVSPVREKYILSADNSAICEIPDKLVIDMYNGIRTGNVDRNFAFVMNVSYSGISAYNYVTIRGFSREELNALGFVFNRISYLYTFINDEYVNYCMNQRSVDRSMMWANIATGGIAEGGSTGVSAGIGYRSNMERALALQNESLYNKQQANLYQAKAPYTADSFRNRDVMTRRNEKMYSSMAHNAMMMSGVGGVTAFSANAIHQGLAQYNKEKAMRNIPPAIAGAGNVESSIINEQLDISMLCTKCDDTSYERYKSLFMKYGYYIGGVITPNIYSRKYFNYIKTNGAVVIGNVNNLILSALANILDNGVTIWHMDYCVEYKTVNDEEKVDKLHIYDYFYENVERRLIPNE